jgi:hypothetical protein
MYDKKEARKDMLKSLKKMMMAEDDMGLGEKLGKMQKVTVAADSTEGLKKGLSKAEEILKKRKGMMGMEDEEEESESEMCEECEKDPCECEDEESEDSEKEDPKAIKEKMSQLEKKLKKME